MKDIHPIVIVNLVLLGVWVTLFVLSCAGGSGYLPTTDELRAAGVVSGEEQFAALRRGRALAITECSGCHRFYWPQEYPPEEWDRIMREMAPRTSLGEGQTEDLALYFSAASRTAARATDAPTVP
jgi:hypothetical protein